MSRPFLVLLATVATAGCQSPPAWNWMSPTRTTVPPPATGSYGATTTDPYYSKPRPQNGSGAAVGSGLKRAPSDSRESRWTAVDRRSRQASNEERPSGRHTADTDRNGAVIQASFTQPDRAETAGTSDDGLRLRGMRANDATPRDRSTAERSPERIPEISEFPDARGTRTRAATKPTRTEPPRSASGWTSRGSS